eukprot:3451655-Pleurochrysis_carterae.AAC.1
MMWKRYVQSCLIFWVLQSATTTTTTTGGSRNKCRRRFARETVFASPGATSASAYTSGRVFYFY